MIDTISTACLYLFAPMMLWYLWGIREDLDKIMKKILLELKLLTEDNKRLREIIKELKKNDIEKEYTGSFKIPK